MPTYQVQLLNDNINDRTGHVTVGVPFAKGEVTSTSTIFAVNNALTDPNIPLRAQWYPFGPTYSDGSYKYGRFTFPVNIVGNGNKVVTIANNNNAVVGNFNVTPTVQTWGTNAFGLFLLGTPHYMTLTDATVVEGGTTTDHYKRYTKFERHATYPEIWMDVTWDVFSNFDYIRFWFRFGLSYSTRTGMVAGPYPTAKFPGTFRRPNSPTFVSIQEGPIVWVAGGKSAILGEEISIVHIDRTDDAAAYYIMDPAGVRSSFFHHDSINHGLMHAYKGVLYMGSYKSSSDANASFDKEIFAICKNWYPDRYPSYHFLPDYPAYITSESSAKAGLTTRVNNYYNSQVRGDSFANNLLGNIPRAPAPGAQNSQTFGTTRFWPYLRTSWPIVQKLAQLGTRGEGFRPNFVREGDGTWFNLSNYPGVVIWTSSLHFTSQQLFGMGPGVGNYDLPRSLTRGAEEGYEGPDRQHIVVHTVVYDALITGDWHAIEWCKIFEQMQRGNLDTNSINPVVNSSDSSRGIGRSMLATCQLFEVTGNTELLDTIEARINNVLYPQFTALAPQGGGDFPSKLRFMASYFPESRQPAELYYNIHQRPWEESIAAYGLYAAAKLLEKHRPTSTTTISRANEMAAKVAGTVLKWGLIDTRPGSGYFSFFANNWTGQLSEWVLNPSLTFTSSSGGSGSLGQLLFDDSSAGTATTSGRGGLFIRLRGASGTFNIGDTITCSNGRTAVIAFKHTPYLPVVTLPEGSDFGLGRGTPLPDTEWANMINDGTTEYGGHPRYIYFYHGYSNWMAGAIAVALQYAYENYYSSENAALFSKAADFLVTYRDNRNATANPDFWDDELEAHTIISSIGFNVTSSGNTDVTVSPSVVGSVKLVPKSVTVTTTSSVSITVNASAIRGTLVVPHSSVIATSATVNNITVKIGLPPKLKLINNQHSILTYTITDSIVGLIAPTQGVLSVPNSVALVFNPKLSFGVTKILFMGLTTTEVGTSLPKNSIPTDSTIDQEGDVAI